jgi:hypothetical protein
VGAESRDMRQAAIAAHTKTRGACCELVSIAALHPEDARLGNDDLWKRCISLENPTEPWSCCGQVLHYPGPLCGTETTSSISVTWCCTSQRVSDRTLRRIGQGRVSGCSILYRYEDFFGILPEALSNGDSRLHRPIKHHGCDWETSLPFTRSSPAPAAWQRVSGVGFRPEGPDPILSKSRVAVPPLALLRAAVAAGLHPLLCYRCSTASLNRAGFSGSGRTFLRPVFQ